MKSPRQLAKLGKTPLEQIERFDHERLDGGTTRLRGGTSERQGREDEPLLRTVVEVTLELPPHLVRRFDKASSNGGIN
jgi:hypothetical protein